jgi:Protein of unknown function (DUF3224)
MMKRSRVGAVAITAICGMFGIGFCSTARAQAQSPAPDAAPKGAPVEQHASGTFDVKVVPQGEPDKAEGSTLGRMTMDKQYHGDLEATAKGEGLTAGTDVKGSAGYVAIERVTGKLHGRSGSFVLQHTGTMTRGAFQLSVTVVPDSGTGELVGLTGKLGITIDNGKHSYEFDYTLPAAP